MERNCRIVVVIPAYNEEDTIVATLNSLLKIDLIDEIVVVDDGSTDNTLEKIRNMDIDIKTIAFNKNYGKGYAIRTAIKMIDFDYLVLLDADLGESSSDVKKLIYPVLEDQADLTIAKFHSPTKKGGIGLVKLLSKYGVFLMTKKKINTVLSGQRVYRKEVIEDITYIPNNFGIEVAMTVGALKKDYIIKEINVSMTHRETGRNISGFIHRGKQFIDIFKTLFTIIYRGY